MTTIINAVVPIGSVLLGAGLTYWLNVRSRRKNFVEDQFNIAIAAVATAQASMHYLKSVARPANMPEQKFRELLTEIAKVAIENHTQRNGQAREAIACVAQYEPRLKPYYIDAQAIVDKPDAILDLLIEARNRLK